MRGKVLGELNCDSILLKQSPMIPGRHNPVWTRLKGWWINLRKVHLNVMTCQSLMQINAQLSTEFVFVRKIWLNLLCLGLSVCVRRYMSRLTGITIRVRWNAGSILKAKNIAR
ncbi:hypothetical protein D3C72_1207440 [compost metagenome]